MKKTFTENSFFNLNHKERKSVFFLISLLIVSIVIYGTILLWPRNLTYSVSSLASESRDSVNNSPEQSSTLDVNPGKEFSISSFNPNTISQSELENFGLSAKVASTWTKYTSKGGKFKTPTDLYKIYGLKPEEVARLIPYIVIEKEVPNGKVFEPLQPVDLNTVGYKDLIKIGMPGYIAGTLLKFRSKGKIFKSVNDLKQVIGINDSILEIVTPFIQFPVEMEVINTGIVSKLPTEEKIKTGKNEKINFNTADTTVLKYLPGIGSKLALRIVKYRDQLGGFYSVNQLKEIYGLPDSALTKILPEIMVEGDIKKIEVNKVDFTRMYHPYFDKKQASLIQNYIKQHQPITGIEDLKKIEVLELSFWDKIQPYLDFSLK